MSFSEQEAAIALHIANTPGIERLRQLSQNPDACSQETTELVLQAVARFAHDRLKPVNAKADQEGARLTDGRVQMPQCFHEVMKLFIEEGWPGLSASEQWGGHGLPLFLQAGCQELIDRACPSFGMLPGLFRSGARLLEAHGSEAIKSEWLPKIATGEWATTICISEADAGSDVGRIRTRAHRNQQNEWYVTGEKIWISFGDHDLSQRIGHCLLARSDPSEKGVRGLSLFLVPNHIPVNGNNQENGVHVRRLEEKLGLHASPTCALGFEHARAYLIGEENKGLNALFAMIGSLRLSVALQGLGIATNAVNTALIYASERCQGGAVDKPAVPIDQHLDVQRMLMEMVARVEVTRGAALTLATALELQVLETDSLQRQNAADLCAWLLPIMKTWSADTAFEVSHTAIQVLGGAGYTREWPVEQALRDSRILSIYEGTSGIQALDLVHRRLIRDEGRGLKYFVSLAKADIEKAKTTQPEAAAALESMTKRLVEGANRLTSEGREFSEAGASAFLQLAALATTSWIALRLTTIPPTNTTARKISAAGHYWLAVAPIRAEHEYYEATLSAKRLENFNDIKSAFI